MKHRQFPSPPSQLQMTAQRPIHIEQGHNGDQVVIKINQKVDIITFSVEQAEAFIAGTQKSLDALHEHKRGVQP